MFWFPALARYASVRPWPEPSSVFEPPEAGLVVVEVIDWVVAVFSWPEVIVMMNGTVFFKVLTVLLWQSMVRRRQ